MCKPIFIGRSFFLDGSTHEQSSKISRGGTGSDFEMLVFSAHGHLSGCSEKSQIKCTYAGLETV